MTSKKIGMLRENILEFLRDTFSSFDTVCKTVGSNKQSTVVDKKLFRDYVPTDKLLGRSIVMTWEYYGEYSIVTFTMYKIDHNSDEWEAIKKVVRYAYGYKWPDTIELRDLLIIFVAGGYDGQHFKDGVF